MTPIQRAPVERWRGVGPVRATPASVLLLSIIMQPIDADFENEYIYNPSGCLS